MSPMAELSAVAKQAWQLRLEGNNCFKKLRFGAAIDADTEVQAIAVCPNIPIYWTIRAFCHLKKKDWVRVEIQLDNSSVKTLDSMCGYGSKSMQYASRHLYWSRLEIIMMMSKGLLINLGFDILSFLGRDVLVVGDDSCPKIIVFFRFLITYAAESHNIFRDPVIHQVELHMRELLSLIILKTLSFETGGLNLLFYCMHIF